jgi:signal peptidase I
MRGFFRRCLALILSVLVAGSGQVFNRQPKKGLPVLIFSPVFALLAGWIKLCNTFHGLLIGAGLPLGVVLWAVVDSAVYGGLKAKERQGFSKAPVLYLFAIALIVISGLASATNFYRNHLLGGLTLRVDPSNSMAPTLRAGDRFATDTDCYRQHSPDRDEVVLFNVPGEGTLDSAKRIIAIGGDTIQATKDGVFLNGKLLDEPYAKYDSPNGPYDTKRVFGPTRVSSGQYFLMGDNRDDSWDSRYWGTIHRSQIEGCLLYIYWSNDRSRIGQSIH